MTGKRFNKEVAVVLGGASGIGAATVKSLCQQGARVFFGDVNIEKGEQLAAELGKEVARFQAADLADGESLLALLRAAHSQFGGVDGLVNVGAAGHVGDRLDIVDVDESLIDFYMGVNVKGFYIMCKEAIPMMLERGGGSIVQVSSLAGQYGGAMSTLPIYGMSKAAIDALTRHIAAAYGKRNIRCNNVAPGTTMTEMVRKNAHNLPNFDKMRELIPRPHFAETEDIANVISFLLSSDSRQVNAQTLRVDGGESAVMYPTQIGGVDDE